MLEGIWFALWGIIWAAYFMLDGFDLGLGSLLPVLAKNETEKRLIFNAMGPFWDGNEVWLITAGGVTFAAFPKTYAVMFSALYAPLMIILFALIIRGVAFEFRGHLESKTWRQIWDLALTIGSFIPALLFGVAFANIFQGIPLDAQGLNQGSLLTLLNPYGLLGGVFFVLMFMVHGCIWLAIKSEGELHHRAVALAGKLWYPMLGLAVIFLGASAFATTLYHNYLARPYLGVMPLLAVVGLVMIQVQLRKTNLWAAWFSSALTIVSATLFGVIGLFPNLLPSSLNPQFSLTAYNSCSSPLTLKIMLTVVLIFVPVVVVYQVLVYRTFRGKLTEEDLLY